MIVAASQARLVGRMNDIQINKVDSKKFWSTFFYRMPILGAGEE
jgi:hypothetical protein